MTLGIRWERRHLACNERRFGANPRTRLCAINSILDNAFF
jgi:hypothetical protein